MAWAVNDKEKQKEYIHNWYLKNKKRLNKEHYEKFKLKYHNDPEFKKRHLAKVEKYRKKRLKFRFTLFMRDNFTCQYCGRKSPDVVLQIDHIYPKSKGGGNEIDNYITACQECNLGKGDCILE